MFEVVCSRFAFVDRFSLDNWFPISAVWRCVMTYFGEQKTDKDLILRQLRRPPPPGGVGGVDAVGEAPPSQRLC